MLRWETNICDDRCAVCGDLLEYLVDDEYSYGERCPKGCYRRISEDAPEDGGD